MGENWLWSVDQGRALLAAAPAIQLLEAKLQINTSQQVSRAILRNEPPFQALRMRRANKIRGLESLAEVIAFSSDLRCYTCLEDLTLGYAVLDTRAAMGAVVDACIALRLRKLQLLTCRTVPAALPELTRLVAAGTLRGLWVLSMNVQNNGVGMFDEAHESTRLFVAAVRASAMVSLEFDARNLGVLPADVVEAAAFINARQQ